MSYASDRRWPAGRGHPRGWLLAGAVAAAVVTLMAGCTEASPEGTAVLRNATGEDSFEVVIRDLEGRRTAGGTLEDVYIFDTQFTDRERQCLEAGDGGFEVVDGADVVFASHDFADRPVCELDEIVLKDDGSLTWR
ncbi:hypothetical protein [Nocardioides astragali]|uniref:Lipoprotein n=1 Tax=Nocardioides astragali TaxID=1776736 RepID=A0ABW2MZC4_9ACTN|nr:hypothetical protein [Nocardioides astragali]